MRSLNIAVKNLNAPMCVRDYLRRVGLSVTLIKRVKYGGILLEGKPVTVREMLENGMNLEIILPDSVSENIPPMDIPLTVLYEDEYILAVDKPKGMPTHPSKGNNLPTLANAVMGKFGGNFVFRAINRLDRDTSGIVIIAKDPFTAQKLSDSMKCGNFKKKYVCTVVGTPEKKHGMIDAPIRRAAEGEMKRIVAPDGKSALTEYTVLSSDGETSICEILLHSGRTHQIRVHMAHIGYPLYGDFLYGDRSDDGYFLRCTEISFPHPYTNELLKIHS